MERTVQTAEQGWRAACFVAHGHDGSSPRQLEAPWRPRRSEAEEDGDVLLAAFKERGHKAAFHVQLALVEVAAETSRRRSRSRSPRPRDGRVPLKEGMTVEIHGLVKGAAYNGSRAKVTLPSAAAPGRVQIALCEGGKELALKRECVFYVPTAWSVAVVGASGSLADLQTIGPCTIDGRELHFERLEDALAAVAAPSPRIGGVSVTLALAPQAALARAEHEACRTAAALDLAREQRPCLLCGLTGDLASLNGCAGTLLGPLPNGLQFVQVEDRTVALPFEAVLEDLAASQEGAVEPTTEEELQAVSMLSLQQLLARRGVDTHGTKEELQGRMRLCMLGM